jgi:iron-sulfur cluster assembly accessory protein
MLARFLHSTFSTATRAVVTVTDSAWRKMDDVVRRFEADDTAFLLSADGGGCSGYSYQFEAVSDCAELLDGKPKASCVQRGETRLFVDPLTEMLLIGTHVDYVREDYSKGIFESKFTFTPQKDQAVSCGCGVSFSMRSV